jgi:hypothetical protein
MQSLPHWRLISLLFICLIWSISCTKPDFNPERIFKEHSRTELDYFIDVGFRNGNINKQTKNIEVSIIGTPQKGDIVLIDSIIGELNTLISPLEIKRVGKGGNLLIYLTPNYKGIIPKNANAMTYFQLKIFGVILTETSIWIPPKSSGGIREHLFRHEFCHALGFSHPKISNMEISKSVMLSGCSVVFNNSNEIEPINYNFSEIDKAVIRILYDKDIPNGLSRKSFIEAYMKFKMK